MENRPALIDGSSPRPPGSRFTPERRATPCDVQLSLSADAEQVVLVRSVIGALAISLGFPDRGVQDVRLAVTEACTNVVRHAYAGTQGRLDVAAFAAAAGALTVTVADRGCGLHPRTETGPGGLGLPLMTALAESVDIEENDGQGTTVRLSFAAAE